MRVVVIGAGVIGVTTAYELARDGHEVIVLDRMSEPAAMTSHANAGLIAPGHAYTWASPKAPMVLLRSLYREGEALRFKPSLDPRLWAWSLRFLRNCTAARSRLNTKRKVRLCLYSQAQLGRVAEETGIDFHRRSAGLLYLFRSESSFERGAANTRILSEEGLDLKPLPMDEVVKIEPALDQAREAFAGAVYCPSDESGDARVFTRELARYLQQEMNVDFRFETAALSFDAVGRDVVALRTSAGPVRADAYVLCNGVEAPELGGALGLSLPVYPVKGYSVTFPISGRNDAPTVGGVDEDSLVAYARFGDHFRVTATAEFSGFDRSHRPQDFAGMIRAIRGVFPNAADYDRPEYWAGLRPMTPEGTPIFGRGRYDNVVVNVGHGHMGWTMSAGSARIVADLVAGREPAIDLAGFAAHG